MYKAFAIVAVIYGMSLLGREVIVHIFDADIGWPELAATAAVALSGLIGGLASRGLTMQPDIVASGAAKSD